MSSQFSNRTTFGAGTANDIDRFDQVGGHVRGRVDAAFLGRVAHRRPLAAHDFKRIADGLDVGIGAFKQLLHQIGFAIGGRQQCGFNATAAVLRQVAGGVHHVCHVIRGQLADK